VIKVAMKSPAHTKSDPETPTAERIAKYLARVGVASRREVERMIGDGRIKMNGVLLSSPATLVTGTEIFSLDDKPIGSKQPTRLWRYHKPAGLVTTAKDPEGRPTVFAHLPPDLPRVVSIGRLDLTTEGLLLLTNDGGLARHLELPRHGWIRHYRVRVHGRVSEVKLKRLEQGLTLEGVHYGPIKAELERVQGSNAWLVVSIREGKNREIRKVMEHLGLTVTRLIRTAFGPFPLGKLTSGAAEEVPPRVLRDQLGSFFTGIKDESKK
jgi:23S rRNA pseudouridine2605 synthase